jgi:peptidoglycan/LPS O-acetylase OafA/YrhL
MYYEFWGSMIALGCALVLVEISNRSVQGLFLLLAWLVASTFHAYMGSFVIGVALAAMYARRSTSTWPNGTIYLIVPALFFLFGYHENLVSGRAEGWYAFFNPLAAQNPLLFRVVLHSIGAALALLLFLQVPTVKRVMSGETGRRLGLMSFLIYLSQILVICSISSWTYEALVHAPHVLRILVCLCVTLVGTVPGRTTAGNARPVVAAMVGSIFDRCGLETEFSPDAASLVTKARQACNIHSEKLSCDRP